MKKLLITAAVVGLFACSTAFAQKPVHTHPSPFDPNDIVLPNGVFSPPAPKPKNGGVAISTGYDGIDFTTSHCNCLPPDTNAAVGGNFIVETANVQFRVFDKNTGIVIKDQSLADFFGAPSDGDPFVVHDDLAGRWYVVAFNGPATTLLLAVSSDDNPTHPFKVYELTDVGGFPDYPKMGYNLDGIFISYNNFGPGGGAAINIASIDKNALLAGSLKYYISVPKFQFRAMPPAQIHDDAKGGIEWFVSTDGNDQSGNTIRVTQMTNYLSSSPTFTYTSLPVTAYRNAPRADQPGGSITTEPNTTTMQVHSRKGRLITAMSSATAADNFQYPKGRIYLINSNDDIPAPALLREALIDPGAGVAVQMPSVDFDTKGNIGVNWMESSKNEFLSMWVGALYTNGVLSAQVAAAGGGFFNFSFRIGDYSTTVLDPTDQTTFWSANEFIGNQGANDIWLTHITGFIAKKPPTPTLAGP